MEAFLDPLEGKQNSEVRPSERGVVSLSDSSRERSENFVPVSPGKAGVASIPVSLSRGGVAPKQVSVEIV